MPPHACPSRVMSPIEFGPPSWGPVLGEPIGSVGTAWCRTSHGGGDDMDGKPAAYGRLGAALAAGVDDDITIVLTTVQRDLFAVGALEGQLLGRVEELVEGPVPIGRRRDAAPGDSR